MGKHFDPVQWKFDRLREEFSQGDVPPAPDFLGSWRWRDPAPGETIHAWTARQARQQAELQKRTAKWLRKGQKVRVIFDPYPRGTSLTNRIGKIHSFCGESFADYVYVRCKPMGRAPNKSIHMIGIECLAPYD